MKNATSAVNEQCLDEKSGPMPLQLRTVRTSLDSFTQAMAVGGATPNTTLSIALGWKPGEPLVLDVTMELLGERREEWRDGYDAGLRNGAKRVLESEMLAQIVTELLLLREVAHRLGVKADYWAARSQENELAAEYWHSVAAGAA
jgi:hypothetical protein